MHTRQPSPPRSTRIGFTLVELLVVITVIVILIAMLAPALDKAVQQAELAVCGANMGSVADGAMTYAFDNQRAYPYRSGTDAASSGNYGPHWITVPFGNHNKDDVDGWDDRPRLRPYMSINAMHCVLAPTDVDLDPPGGGNSSNILTSDSLMFGWKYISPGGIPTRGMLRLGQGLTYDSETYHVLAGDHFSALIWRSFFAAHNDANGIMQQQVRDQEQWGGGPGYAGLAVTVSHWWDTLGPHIGTFDLNFAFDDGSVRRYNNVPWDTDNPAKKENRFDRVPVFHQADTTPQSWIALPNSR